MLGAIIQFLIVAVVVYFVFVLPINLREGARAEAPRHGRARMRTPPITELDLLTEIRDLLAQDAAPRPSRPARG